MAKATGTKRTGYKCGFCKEDGHNARTCPNKNKTAAETTPDGSVKKTSKAVDATTPTVTESAPVSATKPQFIEPSGDVTRPFRRGDSPQPPGCFECPFCLRAGILVLIELDCGTKQLKCEYCHNKTPIKVIVKWGCTLDDAPPRVRGA